MKNGFFRGIAFLCLMMIAVGIFGQNKMLAEAIEYYKKGEYKHAKRAIDLAIQPPSDSLSYPQIWYYRGFIYKKMYQQEEKDYIRSPQRNEAIRSFVKYLKLVDKESERYLESTNRALDYLLTTVHNDVSKQLKANNISYCEEYFTKQKNIREELNIKPLNQEILVKYNMSLAKACTHLYDSLPDVYPELFDKIDSIFKRVLELDQHSFSGHYNLAVHHYNWSIVVMRTLPSCKPANPIRLLEIKDVKEFEEKIAVLPYSYGCIFASDDQEIVDSVVKGMKKAILYLETAHQINPDNLEVVFGLAVAYYITRDEKRGEKLIQEYPQLEEVLSY